MRRKLPHFEIRYDEATRVDEVVVRRPTMVHLEMANDDEALVLVNYVPAAGASIVQGRILLRVERGRWPWSQPRLSVLAEPLY